MTQPNAPIDAVVIALAQRTAAAGFATSDLEGYTVRLVDRVCRRLVEAGKLFKGKVGHRTVRYFARQEWASQYESGKRTVNAAQATAPTRARAPWGADATTHYPHDEHGRPLYKHTVAEPKPLPANAPIRTGTYSPW